MIRINSNIPGVKALIATTFALLALAGCEVQTFDDAVSAINNPPAPPPPGPPPPGPPPPPPPPPIGGTFNPVFSEIQLNVFTPTCASAACHSGGNPAGGL
ncbi:MAG: hypothetical protein QNJ00_17900, partial [Woeseiaceae bacterium]|nr:hypothetical protein [Woeseiaceae bacterium]